MREQQNVRRDWNEIELIAPIGGKWSPGLSHDVGQNKRFSYDLQAEVEEAVENIFFRVLGAF